jgi:hypothetical protein
MSFVRLAKSYPLSQLILKRIVKRGVKSISTFHTLIGVGEHYEIDFTPLAWLFRTCNPVISTKLFLSFLKPLRGRVEKHIVPTLLWWSYYFLLNNQLNSTVLGTAFFCIIGESRARLSITGHRQSFSRNTIRN